MKKAVVIFLIFCCILLTGCSVKKVDKLTDTEKFSKEYDIDKTNPFVYSTYDDIMEILNDKNAIVLFANSDDEKSVKAVEIIYNEAKKNKTKKIYYYNPKTLKEKQPKKYERLLKRLSEDIPDYKLKLPTLFAIEDGKIINYSDYFSKKEQISDEYLTNKKLKTIKTKYSDILNFKKS